MEKNKICLLLIVLSLFFSLDKANAECDNKTQLEINTASSNITMNYSLDTLVIDSTGKLHPEILPEDVELSELSEYALIDKVTINVKNVTDKVYVVLHSNDDNINKEYHYQDLLNGSFSYEVPDLQTIRKYTLTVYSDVSECSKQELRTIELTTPMYNGIADEAACENNDAYYCQKYVTTPINEEDITYKANDNNNGNSVTEKIKKEQNLLFTVGIVVIVIIIAIVLIIKNKQKKEYEFRKSRGN